MIHRFKSHFFAIVKLCFLIVIRIFLCHASRTQRHSARIDTLLSACFRSRCSVRTRFLTGLVLTAGVVMFSTANVVPSYDQFVSRWTFTFTAFESLTSRTYRRTSTNYVNGVSSSKKRLAATDISFWHHCWEGLF